MLRLATRKSPLALWQAHYVKQILETHHPHLKIEFVTLVTAGDKNVDTPLIESGGKSLFVKELQQALLENQADIAVHSIKDMSATPCTGLQFAAICEREDPRDVLVSRTVSRWQDLPPNAIVGTTSPRRQSQLLALRPDIQIKSLRGNVGTRLEKLDRGDFDAVILAAAGLKRLGLQSWITQYFDVEEFFPAIGQGALGIECRANDAQTQAWTACLDHPPTHQCVIAERAVNVRLGGDCYTPIGAYATIKNERLFLQAMVGSLDGYHIIREKHDGLIAHAEHIGTELAEKLLARGASALLSR